MSRTIVTYKLQIIPMEVNIWIVWDEAEEVTGPYLTKAIAIRTEEYRVSKDSFSSGISVETMNIGDEIECLMDYPYWWCLIPEFADNGWVELDKHGFFTEKEAKEQLEQVRHRKEKESKNKEESNK